MNKARLIRNRMIVQWSGVSRIAPLSKPTLKYKRRKFRENRVGVFNDKKYINEEYD